METPARLIVDLGRLDDGRYEHLKGVLARELLELEDLAQVRPAGGLAYDLACELLPENELLVRGTLTLPCACICGRCGGDFEATFAEQDYCEAFNVAGLERLDLTESVREGIILALPSYPICKEACLGPCACAEGGGASPFAVLDQFEPQA